MTLRIVHSNSASLHRVARWRVWSGAASDLSAAHRDEESAASISDGCPLPATYGAEGSPSSKLSAPTSLWTPWSTRKEVLW